MKMPNPRQNSTRLRRRYLGAESGGTPIYAGVPSQNLRRSRSMTSVASQGRNSAGKRTFADRVYNLLRQVPKGKVTTYKDIAHALGTGAYRSVGQALKRNPYAPAVPCHRVVASDGHIGGFMGVRDGPAIRRKIMMLKREGVKIEENRVVDFEQKRHVF